MPLRYLLSAPKLLPRSSEFHASGLRGTVGELLFQRSQNAIDCTFKCANGTSKASGDIGEMADANPLRSTLHKPFRMNKLVVVRLYHFKGLVDARTISPESAVVGKTNDAILVDNHCTRSVDVF